MMIVSWNVSLRLLLTFLALTLGVPARGQNPSARTFSLARCTDLPVATQMHGSAVVGSRLYIFGGSTGAGYTDRVFSAPILENGTLGRWKEETPLPDLRHYIGSAVEVVNNRIYVTAGATAPTADTPETEIVMRHDVLWTTVRPDGSLAPWRVSDPFPGPPRANLATCSTSDRLYVLGGNSNTEISNKVLMAEFDEDGAPRGWRTAGTMPSPLWFQGAAILDERLYLWGGLTTVRAQPINGRVYSAAVRPDGTVGDWREETPMPTPLYSAAFCGFNDYLICVGGRVAGALPCDKIWFSRLENGRVGQWQSLSSDLRARVYHCLGLDRTHGRLYITGGKHRAPGVTRGGDLLATVQAFELGAPPRTSPPPSLASVLPATAGGVRESLERRRPVLLYFRSPLVPAVGRFEESVLSTPEFRRLAQRFEMRTIDASRDQSLCYEYSVFQVPSMVVLTPDGQVRRSGMLRTLEGVREFLEKP